MRLRSLEEVMSTDMVADLNDPKFAKGYLRACLAEARANCDSGLVLVTLRRVFSARSASPQHTASDSHPGANPPPAP